MFDYLFGISSAVAEAAATTGDAAATAAEGTQQVSSIAALATTFLTDYGQPADEEQIWSIWQGNARVKR